MAGVARVGVTPSTVSQEAGVAGATPLPEQVLFHRVRGAPDDGHERATHEWIAREVADMLGVPYGGVAEQASPGEAYHVPDDTLEAGFAARLGIRSPAQLLGGVVPHPFVATKIIVHPLVAEAAARIPDWSPVQAQAAQQYALPGFSAFDAVDALQAYEQLAAGGRVRLKLPTGVGGRDQWLLDSADDLRRRLDDLPADYLSSHGVVLERHLERLVTYSIGEVECAGLRIAYHGTQVTTRDREGREVYGGSDLSVVRGTLASLGRGLRGRLAAAVAAAQAFDESVRAAWPELLASRRNYDVACGVDARGQRWCGVLEQSWRIGGATPAELAALQAFRREPALARLHACTRELHGRPAPEGAEIYYGGEDPRLGPLTKYRLTSRF